MDILNKIDRCLEISETIHLTNTNILKYLKLVQRYLKASGYSVGDEVKQGLWTVTFNDTKIGNITLLMQNNDGKTTQVSVSDIIGYNVDGSDKFVTIPSHINSMKDLYKNIQIMKNMRGTHKTPQIMKLTTDINKIPLSHADIGKSYDMDDIEIHKYMVDDDVLYNGNSYTISSVNNGNNTVDLKPWAFQLEDELNVSIDLIKFIQ